MISITTYKIIHFLGILMVFSAYGALIARSFLGSNDLRLRKFGAIVSGIGLFLLLLSGFGLQARYDFGWPAWFLLKFAIWIVLGVLLVFINRKPNLAMPLFWVTVILGFLAILLASLKPFGVA